MIAIYSDDPELYFLLGHILEAEGYESVLIRTWPELTKAMDGNVLHAIFLDCSMAACDAVHLCTKIRALSPVGSIPIAAFISPDKTDHLLSLIRVGMDDWFFRPLVPGRLLHFLARSCSQTTKGVQSCQTSHRPVLSRGDFEIDYERHCASFKGRPLALTPIGFRLLSHLVQFPNSVHSREDLIEVAWNGKDPADRRSVDVYVSRLRRMLLLQRRKCPIRTVHSLGYLLEV